MYDGVPLRELHCHRRSKTAAGSPVERRALEHVAVQPDGSRLGGEKDGVAPGLHALHDNRAEAAQPLQGPGFLTVGGQHHEFPSQRDVIGVLQRRQLEPLRAHPHRVDDGGHRQRGEPLDDDAERPPVGNDADLHGVDRPAVSGRLQLRGDERGLDGRRARLLALSGDAGDDGERFGTGGVDRRDVREHAGAPRGVEASDRDDAQRHRRVSRALATNVL